MTEVATASQFELYTANDAAELERILNGPPGSEGGPEVAFGSSFIMAVERCRPAPPNHHPAGLIPYNQSLNATKYY
jgi:hypothetical protein